MNIAHQPTYTIRQASSSDFDKIYDLKKGSVYSYVEKIWGWNEEYQYNDFSSDFKHIDNFRVIASEGSFIGFIQTFMHNNTLEINEIHLLPQFRGHGIGSDIIRNIIKCAKAKRFDISIGCFKENDGAKALYLRLGFTLIAETDTHFILKYCSNER